MRSKRTLTIMLVILAILPGLTRNFTPQVKAECSSGVRQGVLLLMTSTYVPYPSYRFPALVAQKLGLPYDIVEVDITAITNSTFYDENGNGKYMMIFMVSPAPNYINSTEWGCIDAYEQAFNVSEASLYVYNFPSTVWSRYGISTVGSSIVVENVTFTGTNNIRLEMLKPTGENGTGIVNVTLLSSVKIYAKAGNNTMDYPFLWAYKGTDGVWRTASSHFDTAPLWLKYWSWMPTVLALKLSPNNVLFNTYIAYDIDDLNSEGFGRNINATEAQEMVEFYNNYSMPFQLATMNAEEQWWHSEYDPFWDVVRNNTEAFDVYYHATLDTEWYKKLDEAWTFLNDKNLNEIPLYYCYIPPGRHWINSTVVQYDYENFGVRFFAQDTSQYYPSQYYPSYTNAWLLVRYGFGTDNSTFEFGNSVYDNYAQLCRYHIETVKSALMYTGYIVFWGHYPGFVNDQPMLKLLRNVVFGVGIHKTVGVRTYEIAFMSRTMGEKGSYNITSPVYYPSTQQLQFSLTSKGTAPDDICGIIMPTGTAKMNDAIAVLPDKDSTSFLFKYEAGKTYTIYLNQRQPEPYITLFQGWVSTASYSNHRLTFTVSAPSGTTSTTKVYCGSKGKPVKVSGASSWSYENNTLTINVTHSSEQQVVIDWLSKAYSPSPQEVTSAPSRPCHIFSKDDLLFIGTGDGKVYRSSDDGGTWTKVLDTENPNVQCYLLEDDAQGNLYTSFDNHKLYRSTDNGDSWTVVFQSTSPPVYFPTGEFFDMKNGTILAGARSDQPLLYRSNDWGVYWNLWINFSQVFPEYAQPDPNNPSNKAMKHLHLVTYFNHSIFVSTGEYVKYHFRSVGSDLTQNSSWQVDFLSTFTSEYTMSDRILLGVDMGDSGIWMYKDGEYKKVYNPNKDVAPYVVFKHFAHDLENNIIYVPIGYGFDADQTILASPDKGETWFNFINITQTQNYGIVQVEVHKNYLWYVIGYKTYKLPKPSRAELINSVKGDTLSLNAYENVYSYTSSVAKAYKNVNITISNLTWTNLAPNPSFESFTDGEPTNWRFWAGSWSGTSSRGQETTDVYHGSKAYYIEVGDGDGFITTHSDIFTVNAGYYYLGMHFKANSSWFKGNIELSLYTTTDGWKNRYASFHSLNSTWQQLGISFYLTTTQNAKIYLIIQSPTDYNITTRVIFDSVILVSSETDKAFQLDYWTDNLTSESGSIEINGETFVFTSLPTTVSLTQYLVGEIKAKLTNAKLVSLTITGTEVVTIQSGSLLEIENNVYKGRHYSGFRITKNTENKLMVFSDELSTLNSVSLSTKKLTFTVSAPSGTTSITKVYCSNEGEPRKVYITNGPLTWSYNASTKTLTLNVTHLSPARVVVYWRFPGDIDGDGDVDPNDFYIFAGAYGTSIGGPNYNPEADLNGDGSINSDDFYIFSRDYGKTEP